MISVSKHDIYKHNNTSFLNYQHLHPSMCFLMTPQVPWSTERLQTVVARVGLVLHMSHPVVVQVGASSETLSTGLTFVWLLSCVDSPVSVQGGAGGECFITKVT